MKIISPKKEYLYELERLSALFFEKEKHILIESREFDQEEDFLFADADRLRDKIEINAVFCRSGKKSEVHESVPLEELKYADTELILARYVYDLFSDYTGRKQQWGILTGVRPVKLIGNAIEQRMSKEDVKTAFVNKRRLSEDKFNLAYKTYFNEKAILDKSTKDSFSLYVGIPFCPGRCSYCSFVSQSVEKSRKLIEPYVEKLCEEVAYAGKITADLGLKLRTVYIGGGTPTILTAEQLERLMEAVNDSFDVKSAWEYTVEAGRADTITEEKLAVIKKMGATRISINPQTFNDGVLKAIGRNHTGKDTEDRIQLARTLGFDNINTDIIAGLPTDTVNSFKATVDKLTELSPANITVHTLSVKRAADISKNDIYLDEAQNVEQMVKYAQKKLIERGYEPYYLYRQKNMLGNLENTGFCKKGYEGFYNVYIMDETHTIIACGAGSVTKVRLPVSDKLERIANFKFPLEYIENFTEIIRRKDLVRDLYEKDNI